MHSLHALFCRGCRIRLWLLQFLLLLCLSGNLLAQPDNDLFANRETLIGTNLNVVGYNVGATMEPGEPNHAAPFGGFAVGSIWWSWRAPQNGFILVGVSNLSFNIAIGVYTGATVSALTVLKRTTTGLTGYIPVQAGHTYHIALSSRDGPYNPGFGVMRWFLRFASAVANDHFINGTVLSGTAITVEAANLGATTEPYEPRHGGFQSTRSVWWTWQPPADGVVTLWLYNYAFFSPAVAVYSGDDIAALRPVGSSTGPSWVVFPVRAGEIYAIAVASRDGNEGTFSFRMGLCTVRITEPTNGATFYLPTNITLRVASTPTDLDITSFSLQNSAFPAVGDRPGIPSVLIATNPAAGRYVLQPVVGDNKGYYLGPSLVIRVVLPEDSFTNRIMLTGTNVSVSADTRGATAEPGEPLGLNGPPTSIWFTWTAPVSGRVLLDASSSGGSARLEVFTGDSIMNLTSVPVVASLGWSVTAFDAIEGTSYQIRAYPLSPPSEFDIALTLHQPPANDHFTNALPVELGAFTNRVNWFAAGRETGEPRHLSGAPLTVWYRWTAPAPGRAAWFMLGGGAPIGASVYTGTTLDSLTQVASAQNGLLFPVEAGPVYYLAIEGAPAFEGSNPVRPSELVFAFNFVEFPANDNFANRIGLQTESGEIKGNNELATTERGEDRLAERSLWYSWRAPSAGALTVSAETTAPADEFRTSLTMFTGSALDNLTYRWGGNPVTVPVAGGRVYHIRFDGTAYNYQSDFVLRWQFTPRPSNDLFAARTPIAGAHFEVSGSNAGAGRELDEPAHGGYSSGRSLWWTWTAPYTGWVRYAARNSEDYLWAAAFKGTALDKLIRVSSYEETQLGRAASFSASQGGTYQLVVDIARYSPIAYQSFDFSAVLDLTTLELTSPIANAVFASASPILFSVNTPVPEVDGTLISADYWITRRSRDSSHTFVRQAQPPFEHSTTNLPPGWYTVHVEARNSLGKMRISPRRDFTVRPANDDFTKRSHLSGHQLTVLGTTGGASRELGEASITGESRGRSVWFSWTAPASGSVQLSLAGDDYRAKVFKGGKLLNLTLLATSNRRGTCMFLATRGATYQILVHYLHADREDNDRYFVLELNQITVFVAEPSSDESFVEGQPIRITATTTERAADIQKLEFRANDAPLATIETAPFIWVWSNAPPARYELTAVLRLTNGTEVVSKSVPISVLPLNDHFRNRQSVSGTDVTLDCSFAAATREPDEPGEVAGLWFSWRAPARGVLNLLLETNPPLPLVSVYSGNAVDRLTALPRLNFASEQLGGPSFAVEPGIDYAISVGRYRYASVPVSARVQLRFFGAATNDNFADRTLLLGTNLNVSGTALLATSEPNEPTHGDFGPLHSVWWTWTAPANGIIRLSQYAPWSLGLSVYQGNTLAKLVRQPAVFNTTSPTFFVRSNITYHIAWDDITGEGMVLNWELEFEAVAANDDFGNRYQLVGTRDVASASNLGATREVGEPIHKGVGQGYSLWWTWTAPGDGPVILTSHPFSFNPVIAVYLGDSLESLMAVTNGGPGFTFIATAQRTYQIAVDIRTGSPGNFALELYQDVPPPNDQFISRQVVSGNILTVRGSNNRATREFGEPWHAREFGGRSVWYSWTSPQEMSVQLSVQTDARPLLAVYTGTTIANLSEVASQSGPSLTFRAHAGTEYHIVFDGYRGDIADFSLTLEAAAIATAPRISITSDGVSAVLHVSSPTQGQIVLEGSTDLITWNPVSTNAPGDSTLIFNEPVTTASGARFYRAVARPE